MESEENIGSSIQTIINNNPKFNSTNTNKFTYNHSIKTEEVPSFQHELEGKPTQVAYENCSSKLPYEVTLKLSPETICNEFKYERDQTYIKQESDVNYLDSVEAIQDINNIKTEILSAVTNNYNDIEEQEIKNEELHLKDEEDFGVSDVNIYTKNTQTLENNDKTCMKPSIQLTSKIHQCSKCSYQANKTSNLQRHIRQHKEIQTDLQKFDCEPLVIRSNSRPHSCKICDKHFKSKRDIDYHIFSNHFDNKDLMSTLTHKIHECPQCPYKCMHSLYFKWHLLKHNEIQTEMQKFSCKHCIYSTYNKQNLKKHLIIHSNSRPHSCTICSTTFNQKVHIDHHIVSNHSDNKQIMETVTHKIHECQECSYKCIYTFDFKRHLLEHNANFNKKKYKCEHCVHFTYSKRNLSRHLLTHNDNKQHVCIICSKSFIEKKQIDSHILCKHSDDQQLMATITQKIHECSQCSYKCMQNVNLKRHLLVKHKQIQDVHTFQCEHCVYLSCNKIDFKKHLLIHSNGKPHICTICGKSFKQKVQIDYHIVNNHSNNKELMTTITNKIYECQHCSYKGIYSLNLKRHLLKHSEVRTELQKFKCEHCVYSTYNKLHLTRHLLTHSNKKPHVCTICSKSFVEKKQIDSHILSKHSDNKQLMTTITQKIHDCPQCSYKCINFVNLKHHLLKHNKIQTDLQKLKCVYCAYSTYTKSTLSRHLLTHDNNKPHVCIICSKSFIEKKQIDSHILRKHMENKHLMATITHKIHECQQCSYKCVYSLNLKRHLLLKHKQIQAGMQNFKCSHCDYSTCDKTVEKTFVNTLQ